MLHWTTKLAKFANSSEPYHRLICLKSLLCSAKTKSRQKHSINDDRFQKQYYTFVLSHIGANKFILTEWNHWTQFFISESIILQFFDTLQKANLEHHPGIYLYYIVLFLLYQIYLMWRILCWCLEYVRMEIYYL